MPKVPRDIAQTFARSPAISHGAAGGGEGPVSLMNRFL